MGSPQSLAAYLPDLLLERLAQERPVHADGQLTHHGATLFADLAGFTALADRLAEAGPSGPERLTEVLDHVFGRLIDLALRHGGDVVRFAGDAILVLWRADDREALPQATLRACACALEAVAAPLQPPHLAGAGLSVRVGIGAGPLQFYRLGGLLDRWEFAIVGEALRGMGLAAERAEPGEVMVSDEAWPLVENACVGARSRGGGHRLHALAGAAPAPTRNAATRPGFPTLVEAQLRLFVPGAVRHRHDAGIDAWLAELRPLSVLFINLPVGRGQAVPDRGALQQLVHLAQRELYRFEGAVDKLLMDDKGCTLLAAFGLPPLAHEDDAVRALRSAQAISAHLASRGVHHRIGVATGRVFAGSYGHPERREYSILGDTVNLAARLMQQAHNEVLCCAATRRAVHGRIELESLEPRSVKGKREPVPRFRPVRSLGEDQRAVAQAVRPGEPTDRVVVGRKAEREVLSGVLADLAERGQGGLLLLRGEAGIGKSLLVSWLIGQARARGIVPRLGSGDAIEQSAPYRAWRPILSDLSGSAETTDVESLRTRAQQILSEHPSGARWAPLLRAVLPLDLPDNEDTAAMSGPVRGENTRDLLIHLLRACIGNDPLFVVLEDAHWLDAASWALTAAVRRRLPGALIVLAARPMLEEEPAELGELLADGRGGRVLEIGPLRPGEVADLAASFLGVESLPPEAVRLLIERVEGNPFYTEELAGTLRELGILRVDGGRCTVGEGAETFDRMRLPDSVQGAITSRLDRLDPHQQLTLKVASVVGRSFGLQITRDVHPVEEDRPFVGGHIEASERAGLVTPEDPGSRMVFRFRHSVTQQVAYDLLAYSQRRRIHSAVARWYESARTEDPQSLLPRLAHHWREAGDVDKTLHYCARAGEQALARGAPREAIYFLRCAAGLLDGADRPPAPDCDPLRDVQVRRKLGEAYASLSETRLAIEQQTRALAALGHPFPRTFGGLLGRAALEGVRLAMNLVRPRWFRLPLSASAMERLTEVTRLESRLADGLFALTDLFGMVVASLAAINHAERMARFEPAAHAYNAMGYVMGVAGLRGVGERFLLRARSGDALAVCNGHYARGLWYLGDARFEASEREIRAGLERARRVGDGTAIATGVSCLGTRFELVGDYEVALSLWRELFHVAHEAADVRHELWASIAIGGSLCMLGRVQEGLDWIRRNEHLLAGEDRMTAVGFHGQRAQAFLRAGELALAREAADLTRQYVRATGTHIFTHVKGLTGMCEAYLGLWERAGGGSQGAALPLRDAALDACRLFRAFAGSFPVGASRAARFSGTAAWLEGRPRQARSRWQRAVELAEALGMEFDAGLAREELARFERS